MSTLRRRAGRAKSGGPFRLLLAMIGCGGMFARDNGYAQSSEAVSSESAAQALAKSIEAEQFNQRYGPVRVRTSAGVGAYYTDNVFYSGNPKEDVMIEPQAKLDALWPVTRLNALRLSLGLSYQWYLKNTALNSDAPLVNPGSELAWNLFVGDFHIQLHERFSYEQSLFFNSFAGENQPFYNFNNVGTFSRWDNHAGLDVTWSLEKGVVSVGYNHENFISKTAAFDYLDRASEWFTANAGYFLGDHVQAGVEGRGSLHHYDQETVLNDNWRARVGPFVEAKLPEKVTLRAGGGYDTARFDEVGPANSDYDSYYAYARVSQDTRLFTHSIEVGRKLLLGDNANNLKTVYARYSISSPIVRHVDLGAHVSVNVAEEYGGPSGFDEKFTYYGGGLSVGYQFAKHWRADLGYEFLLKESDLALRDFHRNQVGLDVVWTF
ncbi:MAG: hypothetical protein KGJ60_02975 [Verrucomicrobiota bacterium]|nr:hypothetical protein [Verrucomicrobiota bacterium]